MILLFKTNLHPTDELKVRKLLNTIDTIERISFDFEDCDKILRVVSTVDLKHHLIHTLQSKGFHCSEL